MRGAGEGMTIDEFYSALALTPRQWGLAYDGSIRLEATAQDDGDFSVYVECCPITSLKTADAEYWRDVADQIGLPVADAHAIVSAADRDKDYDQSVRARLLVACGLRECPR